MSLIAAVGQAQDLDGREASIKAARQALDQVDRASVVLGWVIAAHDYPIQQVLSGASSLLGDIPLIGFSTSAELTSEGQRQRTVIVALLAGEDIQVQADWWPGFIEDSRICTHKMIQILQPGSHNGGVFLVVADGLNGDAAYLCAALPKGNYSLAGCLAGGDLFRARTFQIGGRQSGSGGLAAAMLTGKIAMGVGVGHGWQPVGAFSRLTRVQGMWVRSMDGNRPSETYANLFGHSPRDWAFPPLNELVRIYPLGLDQEDTMLVRSPLRMEADGSLRMNTALPEGKTAYLLLGSIAKCQEAAQEATRQALVGLKSAKPALALILVDVAWQTLLVTEPGLEVEAVRSVLGPDVPIVGGYTLGQIARPKASRPAQLLNQHIEVILFGEPS